jgi:peptidoglycan/LPS O-acetylase OafA/YrhL
MITQGQRMMGMVLAIAILLLIPFTAMQLTDEVNWSPFDFTVAGILLLGTALTAELILRKVKNTRKRIVLCGVLLAALFLIWVELAVGLFGTPFAGS